MMIYFIIALVLIAAVLFMYFSSKEESKEDLDEDFVEEVEFPKIAKIKAIKIRKEEYQVFTGKYGALYYVKNNKRCYLTESQKTKIYEI